MRRVTVIGNSGAGKSTFAAALAAILDGVHIELDGLFHLPEWMPSPEAEFRAAVDRATDASPRWVVDGNYRAVRDIVWSKADSVVWLDYARWRTTARVIRRSVPRVITGEELWNGNREDWRNLVRRDPERNVTLWSFTNHAERRDTYRLALDPDGEWSHLTVHHLRHPRDANALLASTGSR